MRTRLLSLFFLVAPLLTGLIARAQTTYNYSFESSYTQQQLWSNNNAPLLLASDGNFYGVADSQNGGIIYRVDTSGNVTVIYSFSYSGPAIPLGGLVQGTDGYLYGVTQLGGSDFGSFYKVALDGSNFTDLHDYANNEGGGPVGGYTLGPDGNFYGIGNSFFWGAVTPVRHPISAGQARRAHANRAAVQTTLHPRPDDSSCGEYVDSSLQQMSSDGTLNTLYCGTNDDVLPAVTTPVLLGSDGNFYAISQESNGAGQIAQVTPQGVYTPLGPDLSSLQDYPQSQLAPGPDGKLYVAVDTSGCGSILQFDPANSFAMNTLATLDCTDAEYPSGLLYLGSDGAFYGAGNSNSGSGAGGIYRIDTAGNLSYPYDFTYGTGAQPKEPPVQAADGTFFGFTQSTNSQGDANYSFYQLVATPAPLSPVSVEANFSTVGVGSAVTLGWTVTNSSPFAPPVCVALVNNATGIDGWSGILAGSYTASLYSGSASVAPSTAGTYNFEIVCNGIGAASTTVTVVPKTTPSVLVSSTSVTPTVGDSITLVATMTGTSTTPSGNVTFMVGNLSLGTAPLVAQTGNIATANVQVNTAQYGAGSYTVTASYAGDVLNTAASATLPITLQPLATSVTLSITDAVNTSNAAGTITNGSMASVSAQLQSSGNANFGGSLVLTAGGNVLATLPVSSTGTVSTTVQNIYQPAGTYTVTAYYTGDAKHAASSAPITVTIQKAPVIVSEIASSSSVQQGQQDQFTAIVTSATNPGPTGTVLFHYGDNLVCAATLTAGSASCQGTAPENARLGAYEVVATYAGDHEHASGSSPATTVTVTKKN